MSGKDEPQKNSSAKAWPCPNSDGSLVNQFAASSFGPCLCDIVLVPDLTYISWMCTPLAFKKTTSMNIISPLWKASRMPKVLLCIMTGINPPLFNQLHGLKHLARRTPCHIALLFLHVELLANWREFYTTRSSTSFLIFLFVRVSKRVEFKEAVS